MRAPTVPGSLDGADFRGKTKSFTVLEGGGSWRRESSNVRTIGGSRLNVEKYRCRRRDSDGHALRASRRPWSWRPAFPPSLLCRLRWTGAGPPWMPRTRRAPFP